MTNKQDDKEHRIVYLDALKVFSLLMVFALHTQRGESVTDPCPNVVLFYAARSCMPLFFMVNGCLMLRRDDFPVSYYKRKMIGIVRVLLISGICIGLYVLVVHHFSPAMAAKEMLKGFLSYTGYAYLWFLYSFALIYTILLLGFQRIKKNINMVLLVLCGICLMAALCSVISVIRGGFFIQSFVTQRFRIWTWLFYFCLGYKLSLLKIDSGVVYVLRRLIPVLTAIAIVWQYWLCVWMTGQIESSYMYDDGIIILYSAALFLLFRTSPRLSSKFARFCDSSFGAFLIHGFVMDAFQLRRIVKGPVSAGLSWVCLVIVCWTLSWVIGRIPVLRRMLQY